MWPMPTRIRSSTGAGLIRKGEDGGLAIPTINWDNQDVRNSFVAIRSTTSGGVTVEVGVGIEVDNPAIYYVTQVQDDSRSNS